MLVRNEPRSAFVQPDLCNACLALGADERRAIQRRALSQEKQRVVRRAMHEAVQSIEGRAALRQTSRDRFLTVARTMFATPDRHAISEKVKAAAVTRIARLGGDQATEELRSALEAVGTDAGRIAAMLANGAITDDQARMVARALAKLAKGNEFPKAFAERMRVRGGLPMTTGLAATASATPRIARAAAYEIHAAASIADNKTFPYPFRKGQIASFHYRFQHNRYGSVSTKQSYEGDIVIQHERLLQPPLTTFVDFKHSITGKPFVTPDELERIFHGLARGEIDRAVIVSSHPLSSLRPIEEVNERIRMLNHIEGDNIPPILTFVQRW